VPFEAKKVALVVPPPASADVPRMLASWSWLVGGRFRPIAINRFGDWFLERPDGSVEQLGIHDGELMTVAPTVTAWKSWLATDDAMAANWDWLVLRLHDLGKVLGPDQVFGFKVPPLLGGTLTVDNVGIYPIATMMALLSPLGERAHGGR